MNKTDKYLAVFLGSSTGARTKAWTALSDEQRKAQEQKGMIAWGTWMEKHKEAIVDSGGPLGKTKHISHDGITDVTNEMSAFVVVRAPSHAEAAKMFEAHPHFTIFPGDSVEVMPLLPVPGM